MGDQALVSDRAPNDATSSDEATTAPAAANESRMKVRWYEPLVYVAILVVWFGVTVGAGHAASSASLSGEVATTQAEADKYNADAASAAQGAVVVMALIAMAFVANRVGYRGLDAFMLLVPILGAVIFFKLLWRLACLHRRYWTPRPPGPAFLPTWLRKA
jgi:hypothetical protein